MPVDRFGKLIVQVYRRKRLGLKDYLLTFGVLGGLALVLTLCSWSSRSALPDTSSWPTTFRADGTGRIHTRSTTVSSAWLLDWQCNKSLQVEAVYKSGQRIQAVNVADCTASGNAGTVLMHQAGTITLQIHAPGYWSIAIREPQ
jgi:hypothetical protein